MFYKTKKKVPEGVQKAFWVVFKTQSDHQLFLSRHGRKQVIKVRGEDLVVACSDKSQNLKWVRICKLPPSINLGIVRTRLGLFGKIDSDPEWETYRNLPERKDLKTGWLVAYMTIDQHIPSFLNIGPYRCLVIYEGQPKTCRQCDSTEHMWNKCPVVLERNRRRFNRTQENLESIAHLGNVDNPAPPPLVPVQPHDPPSAPAAPPQPHPSTAPPAAPTSPLPRAPTSPGGGKGKNMAPKTPAATAAGKNTGRDKALKTKPAVGKSKSGPSNEKADKTAPGDAKKRSASAADLQSEANNDPTRPRSGTTSSAESVRASASEQAGPSSSPAEPADIENMAMDDASGSSGESSYFPCSGVPVSVDPSQILDSPQSLGIPLTIPGESPA